MTLRPGEIYYADYGGNERHRAIIVSREEENHGNSMVAGGMKGLKLSGFCMEAVNGTKLPSLPVSGLKRVRDLVYFDGPLLTQFEHPNGDDYLYYWCDCDSSANRWMVLRVSEANILRLIGRFVPLDFVITKGCMDDFVYLTDIALDGTPVSTMLVRIEQIPLGYQPEDGAYLG
jgi:hypothetical protein